MFYFYAVNVPQLNVCHISFLLEHLITLKHLLVSFTYYFTCMSVPSKVRCNEERQERILENK